MDDRGSVSYETVQELARQQDKRVARRSALIWMIGAPAGAILVALWLTGTLRFGSVPGLSSNESIAKAWIQKQHGGDTVTWVNSRSAKLGIDYSAEQAKLDESAKSGDTSHRSNVLFDFRLTLIASKPTDAVRIQYRALNRIGMNVLTDTVIFLKDGKVSFTLPAEDEGLGIWSSEKQIDL